MKKTIAFILFLQLGTSALAADSSYQMARFEPALKIIEQILISSSDTEDVVNQLVTSPQARIAAFNLQALGKMYSSEDTLFSEMRKEFKSIEDNIGQVDKWTDLKNSKNRKKAVAEFADLLAQNQWSVDGESPRIQHYIKSLKKVKWLAPEDDRTLLIDKLSNQLKKITTTKFDFETLEEGNGLHEYRRQVRWFLMQTRVLNGLVVHKSGESCPNPELTYLLTDPLAQSKYAQLPINKNEPKACKITRCYFVDVARVVEEVGNLKDEAEQLIGNTDSDETPKSIARKAEKIAKEFENNGSLEALIEDFDRCR